MEANVVHVGLDYEYIRDVGGRTRGLSYREINVSVQVQDYEIDLEFVESKGTVQREPHETEDLMKEDVLNRAIDAAEAELEDLGFDLEGE